MKKILFFILFFSYLSAYSCFDDVRNDLDVYISKKTINTTLTSFVFGGIIANSELDQNIQDYYQKNIRSKCTDKYLYFWKKMGQDEVLLAYASLGLFSLIGHNTALGNFLNELLYLSGRAFAIGTIPLHTTKALTGGCRPSKTTRSSYWKPFTHPHGVSGHTFTGAILFITWAKMVNNIYFKSLLYTTSTLTGISRVNDNCHYPSQVFLGWMMAYLACDAVFNSNSNFNLSATPERVAFDFEF